MFLSPFDLCLSQYFGSRLAYSSTSDANLAVYDQKDQKIDRYQQKLTDNKDADQYFIAFEHFASREGWAKET